LGDLCILNREDLIRHLDDGYLSSKGVEEVRKLDTDCARSDNQELLRETFVFKDRSRSMNDLAINIDAREWARPRSGSDDDIFKLVGYGLFGGVGDNELVALLKNSVSGDYFNLVLFHQVVHAT